MAEELDFVLHIIIEILDFMETIGEITLETKLDKMRRVQEIITILGNLINEDGQIIWPKRLERFGKLDEAQKAFVILAVADAELDFSTLIQKGHKIETLVKISYLKEVRWFSLLSKHLSCRYSQRS